MSVAVSTALRDRYRAAIVPQLASGNFRTLSDVINVADDPTVTYLRIVPGDRIESMLDSSDPSYIQGPGAFDSLAVSDGIVLHKSTSPKLTDSVDVTDSSSQRLDYDRALSDPVLGTIDFVLPQYVEYQDPQVTNVITIPYWNGGDPAVTDNIVVTRVLAPAVSTVKPFDSIAVDDVIVVQASKLNQRTVTESLVFFDNYRVTISRIGSIVTNSRIQSEAIDVTDAFNAQFFGINVITLSDALSVTDAATGTRDTVGILADNMDVSDAFVPIRFANRITPEAFAVIDDRFPTRNAEVRSVVVSESFAVIDRAFDEYTEFIQVSAEIIVGIEVQ